MCAMIGNRQSPNNAAQDRFDLRRGDGPYQWAQAFPGSTVPTAFWAIRIGANLGYHGAGSPLARMAVWAGTTPTNRRAQTAWFDTYEFSGPTTGALLEHRMDLDTAVILQANQGFSAGIAVEAHANEQFYAQRSDSLTQRAWSRADVTGPTDPFGTPDAGIGDQSFASGYAFFLEGQFNTKPSVPSDIRLNGVAIPAGTTGLAIVDTTPTITGLFRDVDETLKDGGRIVFGVGEADRLNQVQVIIRNMVTNAIVWQYGPAAAPSDQQAARQFAVTTGALPAGTFKLETRVSDLAGAWSDWSSHRFSVLAATVTTSGPPSGKITDTTPDTLGFTFTSSGSESTSQVKVRLRRNGAVFATSPAIAKVVAPNASSTVTWAQTTFGSIPYTGLLTYEIQARYGASNTWTDWSQGGEFTINAPPNKPSNLSPNGQAFGVRPTLSFTVTDPDDDSATLTSVIEVERVSTGTTVQHLLSQVYVGNNRWECPTNSTSVPAYDTYRYRARFTDASGAQGPWSDYATFVYADVPDVVITAITPNDGSVVTVSGPTISWTTEGSASPSATDQAKRRVLIYRADDLSKPFHQSPWQTTTATSYIVSGVLLKQGNYVAFVGVQNASGVAGQSSAYAFTVAFEPPPAPTGVGVQPVVNQNDYPGQPTGALLTWDPAEVDGFARTEVALQNRSGSFDTIGWITNPAETSYTHFVPPVGSATYAVRHVKLENGDEVMSEDVVVSTAIAIRVPVVLTDIVTGESVAIQSVQAGDVGEDDIIDRVEYAVRSGPPVERRGSTEYEKVSLAGNLHHHFGGVPDPAQQREVLRALGRTRLGSDGHRYLRTVCLRTNDGSPRRFGGLHDLKWTPGRLQGQWRFSATFTPHAFAEDLTVEVPS